MSKFDKLKKLMDPKKAEEILAAIDTPEKALALAGKDREQYLNALEALHGPQAKRAADMGFGDKTWYHGTPHLDQIEKINPSEMGMFGKGTYLTASPEEALKYSKLNNSGSISTEGGGQILPVKTKSNLYNRYEQADADKLFNELGVKNLDELEEKYNTFDRALDDSTEFAGIKEPGYMSRPDHAVIKDKSGIRSTNAAFDPRFKDSPYLMSAVGGAPDVSKALSPFGNLRKAYNAYDKAVQEPISDAAQSAAQKIAEATTIPGMPEQATKDYQETAKSLLGTGLEMAGDPLNYIGAPIAGVSNLIKGAKAAEVLNKLKLLKGGEQATSDLMKLSKAPVGIDRVKEIAEQYMKSKGLKIPTAGEPAAVDPKLSKKIAQAYEDLKHDPNDPKVKKAYDALIKETMDQYDTIKKSGLKISRIEPGQENPYKNSADLLKDIKENNHMWYYPTTSGFGTAESASHPLLQKTKELYKDEPMLANDIFRIVHDYYGHGRGGVGFGPIGEENAWRAHRQMFSPEAAKALTTETRGQNSWVNFGPKGEANRANPAQTVYAEQKAGLLPDWVHNTDEMGQSMSAPELSPIAVGPRISNEVESPVKMITSTPPLESAMQKLRSGEQISVPPSVAGSENFKKLQEYLNRVRGE